MKPELFSWRWCPLVLRNGVSRHLYEVSYSYSFSNFRDPQLRVKELFIDDEGDRIYE